jgi:hypothetical protein
MNLLAELQVGFTDRLHVSEGRVIFKVARGGDPDGAVLGDLAALPLHPLDTMGGPANPAVRPC